MITRLPLLTLSLLACLATAGFRSNTDVSTGSAGQKLYEQHCARCHGKDGTKGLFGARDLQQSVLPDAAIVLQIEKGKGFMPPFRKKLTVDEISEVMLYIKHFVLKNNTFLIYLCISLINNL